MFFEPSEGESERMAAGTTRTNASRADLVDPELPYSEAGFGHFAC
jgi:hypothetical protein